MTRARLFTRRFAATASLLLLAFLLVRFLWFPGAYFAISGVEKLFLILLAVNLIVGPGLSTLVFKPGKKGLVFDLVAIACVEIAILGWSMSEILERRPAFVVFAVDRFEAVTVTEVDAEALRISQLADRPVDTPRLVYAEMPADVDSKSRLIDETVFQGMQDIDRRPEFWRPYAQGMSYIKKAAKPLSALLSESNVRASALEHWLMQHDLAVDAYSYLPVQGRSADGIIILHADIGYPVDVLAIDPW